MSYVKSYEADISFRPLPPLPKRPDDLMSVPPRVNIVFANEGWGVGEENASDYEERIRAEREEKIKILGREVVEKKAQRRLTFKAEEELVQIFEYDPETDDEDAYFPSSYNLNSHYPFESDEDFQRELLEFEAAINLRHNSFQFFKDDISNESLDDEFAFKSPELPPPPYRKLKFITDDENLANEMKANFDIPTKTTHNGNIVPFDKKDENENKKSYEIWMRSLDISSSESMRGSEVSSASSDQISLPLNKIPEGSNPEVQDFLKDIIKGMRKDESVSSSNQSIDISQSIPPPTPFSNKVPDYENLHKTDSPLSVSIQKNLDEVSNSSLVNDLNEKDSNSTTSIHYEPNKFYQEFNSIEQKPQGKSKEKKESSSGRVGIKVLDKVKLKKTGKHPYEQNKWAVRPTNECPRDPVSTKLKFEDVKRLNFTVTGIPFNKTKIQDSLEFNQQRESGDKRPVKEPLRWRDVQLPKYEGTGSAYGMSPALKEKFKEAAKREAMEKKLKEAMTKRKEEEKEAMKKANFNAWLARKKREEKNSSRAVSAVVGTIVPTYADFGRYAAANLGEEPQRKPGIVKELSSAIERNAMIFNDYKSYRISSINSDAKQRNR